MEPLLLITPEQHDYDDPSVERNERRLQRWLDELPLLNPPAALPPLREALQGCNAQPMDSRQRLKLLECYRPAVGKLFMAALQGRMSQLRGPPQERERVVEDLEGCSLAMAGGYKLVLSRFVRGHERARSGQLGLALLRALEHLAQGLLHSYRYYRPAPPFVWLELHQIYCHAVAAGCPDVSPEPGPDGARSLSLEGLYRQMLLLALTDPYRLRDGEVAHLFSSLSPYAPLCALQQGAVWKGTGEGLYLVDMASDSPPRACARLSSPATGEKPWLLNGTVALKAMHHRLAQLPAEQRRGSAEAVLLRQLLPEVSAGERRADVRRAARQRVLLLAGLDAVHRQLGGHPQSAAADGEEAASAAPAQWEMVDRSEGGLQLAGDEGGISSLQVGELVGVMDEKDGRSQPLALAVVRWLRRDRNRRLQLGLEFIPGVPAPVQCRSYGAGGGEGEAAPCLFIPSPSTGSGPGATLLTPAERYEPGTRLLVQAGKRTVPVYAGEPVQRTPCFDQFYFRAEREAESQGGSPT